MLSRFARPLAQAARSRLANQAAKSTAASPQIEIGKQSEQVFDRENKYGAHNYHPLPVALAKGEGKDQLHFFLFSFCFQYTSNGKMLCYGVTPPVSSRFSVARRIARHILILPVTNI